MTIGLPLEGYDDGRTKCSEILSCTWIAKEGDYFMVSSEWKEGTSGVDFESHENSVGYIASSRAISLH